MRHELDNGLVLILEENHAARVVAFQAWVNAGSADETDAEAGLAHLHEHMLFKGTEKRGVGEIARAVEAAGGDINAWTSFDQTVYHLVMASRDFGVGLDILADALQRSAFDPEELAREQEVVLEEIKRTYDVPIRRASRRLFELAYRAHPYRRPVIGFEETVRGFSRDDVLAFFHKHYRPENTTLVLVGDFETDDALARITDLFGAWKPNGAAPAGLVRHAEPAQDGLRVACVEDDVKEAYLELAWHIPRLVHPDIAALDALSVILGQGESSRLVHALRRARHVANDVSGYAFAPKDPGLMFVSAQSAPERVEEVLKGALEIVAEARERLVGEDELEKAKNIIESEGVYQHETVQGQARRLGWFETVAGGTEFEEDYFRKVRRLTPEDLRRAAQTYLSVDNLTALALVPPGSELTEAGLKAACEASGGGGARPRRARVKEGEIVRTELPGGGVLLVQPDRHVPLVSMRAAWLGGLRWETPEDNGINQLMARMLTSGTGTRSADEIARQVDEWAASLSGVAGRNSFGLAGEFLSRHLERGMRLFAECLLDPTYPEEELAKERSLQLEEIRAREDDPAGVAFDLFAETLWERHPYRMDVRGSAESLARLDADALRRWHRARYPASRLHLAVVGDVDPEKVHELTAALIEGGGAEGAPLPEVPVEALPSAPRRAEKVLPKAQAHVILGYPGLRLTDPRRHALEVLSAILSGQSGRLFLELRDKRSLAYAVSSLSLEGLDPGYFGVYIGCSPEKVGEAVDGIRAELERLREAPPTADEIDRVQRYLVGTHEIGLQRAGTRAAVFALDEAYGLGWDAHLAYAKDIEGVSADDVLEVARQILDPEREVLAVVRP